MACSLFLLRLPRFVSAEQCSVKTFVRSVHMAGGKECNSLPTEVGNTKMQSVQRLVPNISDYYKGKSVFITGATGFMGKVLVERLLSTCPDVEKLYLLIRSSKDLAPEKRLEQLKESKVFDVLREKDPRQLDKLIALNGELTKPEFDLSRESRTKLEEVSVVFHLGASLRLSEPLKNSISSNLLPTISLLQFCDSLPKLEVFMYLSTEYCHADKKRIEEKIYPPPMELKTLLDVQKHQELDEKLEKKLLGCKPSSYAFTKSMAECEVAKHGCNNFSSAVFRPAIVISSLRDPFPGWMEKMNGASGVIANASSGVLRVFGLKGSARADMVPVDITIDTLIAASWEVAVDRPSETRVYNCTAQENPITWRFYADSVNEYAIKYPSINAIWFPYFRIYHYRYLEWVMETMLQTIPIYVIDFTWSLLDRKYDRRLIQILHKVQDMREATWYFTIREFDFVNDNVKKLRTRLSEKDKKVFNLDPHTMDWHEVMFNLVRGTRKYVMMEPDHTLEAARARLRKMGYARNAAKGIALLGGLKIFSNYFK